MRPMGRAGNSLWASVCRRTSWPSLSLQRHPRCPLLHSRSPSLRLLEPQRSLGTRTQAFIKAKGRDGSKAPGSWGRIGRVWREKLPANTLTCFCIVHLVTDTVASVENHSDSLSTGEQADPATTKQSIVTASETVSANTKMAPSDSENLGTPATDKNIAIATGSKNTQDPAQESVTPTTVLMKTETKSSQDGLKTAPGTEVQSSTSVPASVTTQGGRTDLRSTQHLRSPTDNSPALSSLTTPASTQQLTPGSPKGPDQMTTASSSSGTTAGYTFTPSHPGTATTLSKSCLLFKNPGISYSVPPPPFLSKCWS